MVMRIVPAASLAMTMAMALTIALTSGAAVAQLPGVAATQLEQAPQPNPAAPMYRQTGEQYRVYEFPGTGEPIPYRLFVPETWKAGQKLPIFITLRAGNSINNNHRGGNDLVKVARERGYIVVSPLGYRGLAQPYYGSPYPVDREGGPSVPADGWTAQDNQRAELDVLYVFEPGGRGIQRRYDAHIPAWTESVRFRCLQFRRAISRCVSRHRR